MKRPPPPVRRSLADRTPPPNTKVAPPRRTKGPVPPPSAKGPMPPRRTKVPAPPGPAPSSAPPDQGAAAASLAGSTAVMAAGTGVSRVLGLVRAMVLGAALGGSTAASSAFDVANQLPSLIFTILAAGVLNAVLVPQIVRAFADGRGTEYVQRLMSLATIVLAGLTLVLMLGAGLFISLMSTEVSAQQRLLATTFAYWCMPQVFFYGLYALWSQVLNARGVFGPVMWTPVANNVISIAGFGLFTVVFGSHHSADGWSGGQIGLMGGTATLGIIAQALLLWRSLKRLGLAPKWRFGWRGYGLGQAAKSAGWTFLALMVDQAAIWLSVKYTFSAPDVAVRQGYTGVVANNFMFNQGLALYIIPHSLITVSLTTALFTRMSQAAADRDLVAVKRDLSFGIRTTAGFSFLFTALLMTLAIPIARLMQPTLAANQIPPLAGLLVPLTLGLVPLGVTLLVRRVYLAMDDAKALFKLQIPMTLVWIGFSVATVATLKPAWWAFGCCLGQTLSFVAGAVLRLSGLRQLLHGLDGRRLAWTLSRTAVAGLLTGEVGWLFARSLPWYQMQGENVLAAGLSLVVVTPVMVVLYLVLLRVMGVTELNRFLRPLVQAVRPRVSFRRRAS